MSRRKLIFWFPAMIWMATIFVLSSMPHAPEPPGLKGLDKPEHYIAYALLSIFVFIASSKTWPGMGFGAVMLVSIAIAAAYGVTDEFHQRFVSNRCCELLDWIADLLGAISGAALAGGIFFITKTRKGER